MNDNADLISAVKEMSTEAKTLRGEVRSVKAEGKTSRRMIWLTAASVVLDVLISVALGWNIHETNRTSDKTDAVASTEAEVCQAFNERNTVQLDLWKTVLDRAPHGETPEQTTARQTRNRDLQPSTRRSLHTTVPEEVEVRDDRAPA